jgi:hypothetical protein
VVSWGMADFDSLSRITEALAAADTAMYACKALRKEKKVG